MRLLGLAALSLLVHLWGVTAEPLDYHYHRQVNTAAVARNYAEKDLNILKPQVDWEGAREGHAGTELPVYMWLMGLLWPLLGVMGGRLLSAGFSALTAVYLYWFVRRKLGEREAFWSALAFSLIPLEVYFGRTIQPEAMALCGTMGALCHFDRWLGKEGKARDWLAATLWAACAIGLKMPYAYILGPLAALAWQSGRLFTVPALGAAALALALPAAWYKWAALGSYVVPVTAGSFKGLLTYDQLGKQLSTTFLSRMPELSIGWGAVPLFVLGARLYWRSFFGVWWGFIALSLIASGEYARHHEYTSLPFAPVNAVFIGAGMTWLLQRRRALAFALAAVIPAFVFGRIKHWYNQNFVFLARAGEAAAAVSRPEDLFFCNERASSVILYYLRRRGWSWSLRESGEPAGNVPPTAFFASEKALLVEPYLSYYSKFPLVWDRDGLVIYDLRGSRSSPRKASAPPASGGKASPRSAAEAPRSAPARPSRPATR